MNNTLTEKYRPLYLNQLKGQDQSVSQLQIFAKNPCSVPNLIFSGPPGCGKTSCAMSFVRECIKNFYHNNNNNNDEDCEKKINQCLSCIVLEKNASEENGIDVIRNEVNIFVTNKAMMSNGFPLKFCIFDEADMLTKHSQCALRRVMEDYMEHVRFILLCNDESRIHEAIMSRCTPLPFLSLPQDILVEMIHEITRMEKCESLTIPTIQVLVRYHKRDCRKTLNDISSVMYIGAQTEQQVCQYLGIPSQDDCRQFIASIISMKDDYELLLSLRDQVMDQIISNSMDFKVWVDEVYQYCCVTHKHEYISYVISWIKIFKQAQIAYYVDSEWACICYGLISELWLSVHDQKSIQIM